MPIHAETGQWRNETGACVNLWCWVMRTVAAGLTAGACFALFESLMSLILTGDLLFPIRMVAAIVLGRGAVDSVYSLVVVIPVGTAVFLLFSVFFASLFIGFLDILPTAEISSSNLMAAAAAYGLALWLVNFYAIAPVFRWDWFYERTDPLLQGLVGHVLFYGLVLGYYLKRRERV